MGSGCVFLVYFELEIKFKILILIFYKKCCCDFGKSEGVGVGFLRGVD